MPRCKSPQPQQPNCVDRPPLQALQESCISTSPQVDPVLWWIVESGRISGRHATVDANHSATDPDRAPELQSENKIASSEGVPRTPWSLHPRLHIHSEEAEFGSPQGGPCASHLRFRGHRLHRRHRSQSPGALGCLDPRRSCQGSSRSSLPHHSRHSRHRRGQGSPSVPFQIRRQVSEGMICAGPQWTDEPHHLHLPQFSFHLTVHVTP